MDFVRLTPELCYLRFPLGHAYLWQEPDGLTLIDSGVPGSGPLIAAAIRELGRGQASLRRLVLTHCHADHIGSAAEIARWGGVEVIAAAAEAPYLRGDEAAPPPRLLEWERPIFGKVGAGGLTAEPVQADRLIGDGDELDFGPGARAVAVPGHTPGSLAVHLPGPGVLFTGDAVARRQDGQVILGVFNADPAQAGRSLRRLAALRPSIVCFGHGEPVTSEAAAQLLEAADRVPR